MPRFRKRLPRELSVEQEGFLWDGGILDRWRGESTDQHLRRCFGHWQTAQEAYFLHEEQVLNLERVAGRRPWGWWQWRAPRRADETEQRLDLRLHPASPERPLPADQAAELRRLNLLEPWEDAELSRWESLKFSAVE